MRNERPLLDEISWWTIARMLWPVIALTVLFLAVVAFAAIEIFAAVMR